LDHVIHLFALRDRLEKMKPGVFLVYPGNVFHSDYGARRGYLNDERPAQGSIPVQDPGLLTPAHPQNPTQVMMVMALQDQTALFRLLRGYV
jgi:hypothetical protein